MMALAVARSLLAVIAGPDYADFLIGDLEEEMRARTGTRAGWYVRQVVRSVVPLISMRIRSGEFSGLVAAACFGAMLPLAILDRLWSLVYSQIPLKDGFERAPAYLALNVIALCCCSAGAGVIFASHERPRLLAIAVALAAGLAMWSAKGSTPGLYVVAVLVLAPVSAVAGAKFTERKAP